MIGILGISHPVAEGLENAIFYTGLRYAMRSCVSPVDDAAKKFKNLIDVNQTLC
jgi:hypothetical protein